MWLGFTTAFICLQINFRSVAPPTATQNYLPCAVQVIVALTCVSVKSRRFLLQLSLRRYRAGNRACPWHNPISSHCPPHNLSPLSRSFVVASVVELLFHFMNASFLLSFRVNVMCLLVQTRLWNLGVTVGFPTQTVCIQSPHRSSVMWSNFVCPA